MAEIKITAMASQLGPSLPTPHHARLRDRDWPGGGTVKVLVLNLGPEEIEVWPADPECIADLGEKLIKLARELEKPNDAEE